MSETTLPPKLANLSISARWIYRELDEAGPCTQAELRARTFLSARTVRRALEQLQDHGAVDQRPSGDARSPRYDVVDS